MNARVCVVMPALDEADALPAALAGRPDGVRVVVVDNGSTDGTAAVAHRLGCEVVHEPRRGFGAACWTGAQQAAPDNVVVFVDADGTFTWDDIRRVADAAAADGDATLSLSRRRRDLREPGAMPWHVALANRALGWWCGRRAGVALHDLGPLRAIRRRDLDRLGIVDRTYGWPLEMVLRAADAGLTLTEVPVRYRVRAGTSKVTGRPLTTLRVTVRMLVVLLRLRGRAGCRAPGPA